jgi:Na+-translocating ferredoxin:NAD+ oxidoreductase RnfE subunit
MARSYWDAFGIGVILAVALIVLGSLWSLVTNVRARRVEAGEA